MADTQIESTDALLNRQALIEAIMEALPRSLDASQRAQLAEFIPAYFKQVPGEELTQIGVDDLAGTALAHWQLARTQGDETHRPQVYNPSFDKHGWHSAHTIIQIVARDQSWLVSSMHATLERLGHSVHRIIHPILSVERAADGQWVRLAETGQKESLIHIEIDAVTPEDQPEIRQAIDEVFKTLAVIRKDSADVRTQLDAIADSLDNSEQAQFVRWLDERQFACLGYAQLQVVDDFTALHNPAGIVKSGEQLEGWNTADLMPHGLDRADLEKAFAESALVVCKAGHVITRHPQRACRSDHACAVRCPRQVDTGGLRCRSVHHGLAERGSQQHSLDARTCGAGHRCIRHHCRVA